MTTIKVPRELRDRLAGRAARTRTTLASAIAEALDQVEEREFWAQARAANASVPAPVLEEHRVVDAGVALDDLVDPDDEAVSRAGGW